MFFEQYIWELFSVEDTSQIWRYPKIGDIGKIDDRNVNNNDAAVVLQIAILANQIMPSNLAITVS